MRRLRLVLRLALALGIGTVARPADVEAAPGDAARVIALINGLRRAEGLPSLRPLADLADDARAHARRMARAGRLFPMPDLGAVAPGAAVIGHYAGMAAGPGQIHALAAASEPFRDQMLGDYDHVGVGAVRDAKRRIFVSVLLGKLGR
jgi:hypothetical protein